MRACLYCGGPLPTGAKSSQRYCCPACRSTAARRRTQKPRDPQREETFYDHIICVCPKCGKRCTRYIHYTGSGTLRCYCEPCRRNLFLYRNYSAREGIC